MSNLHTVTDADDDIRLDRWFKRHFPAFQHSLLEKSLRKGDVRVDGKKAQSNTRVTQGQVIDIRCEITGMDVKKKNTVHRIMAEDEEMMHHIVLYRDDNIIVINKPAGLAVQGGTKINKSVDSLLDVLKFDAEGRPKLVHRLDRDTSGVLVLARTAKVAAKLSRAFAGKDIQKTYWALVNGCPLNAVGVIDYKLVKASLGEDSYEKVAVDDEDGKYAKTEYRVMENLARKFALMELKPLTGRTHQLRVHMQAIGCPIVGDPKYGGSMIYDNVTDASTLGVADQLHLHARRIFIPASVLGKNIDISAPAPAHMQSSFDGLGIHPPKK
ncbi:MAG: RluA family pseudouridine synthase [Alphaproteobacteria bacterium]|nr:RluA family pseudouridine synthase [Alphaproteobacteria bacterium]